MSKRTLSPLIGALMFLLFYLAVSPVAGIFSVGELPLPGSPAAEVHDYLAANTVPSMITGLLQALSGLGLGIVVAGSLPRRGGVYSVGHRQRGLGLTAGWTAVAAIIVSAALSIALSMIATTASTDTVAMIRSISFYAGGVVHVVALGVFVLSVVARHGRSRLVRVLAWIAGCLAVLSLLSVVVYYASLFLPVGRLACMVALVVAGAGIARRPVIAEAAPAF
ncbi:MAG: hypothetical protein LBU78_08740 [Microbacterium sp.]|nr:hypothetical protein [Microbacterium sp.]